MVPRREPERRQKRQEAGWPWFQRRPWCRTAPRESNPPRIDLWGRRKREHVKMEIWRWIKEEKKGGETCKGAAKKRRNCAMRVGEKLKKTSESRFMFPSLPMVILRRYPSLVSMTRCQVIEAGSMSIAQVGETPHFLVVQRIAVTLRDSQFHQTLEEKWGKIVMNISSFQKLSVPHKVF